MFVEKIKLSGFRNYDNAEIKFKNGTNVIYGPNAMGKTNILEAICVMSTTRSHRGAKESEMIKFDKDNALISMDFFSHGKSNQSEMKFFSDKKRQICVNGVYASKASEIIGYINTVVFCPEDLNLVKGSPKERRKMLDMGISQLRQKYFHSLSSYYKVLEQRNKLLKDNPGSDMLWVWNEKLAQSGKDIIWYRNSFIERLEKKVKDIMNEISGENVRLKYNCGFFVKDFNDKEEIENVFLEELKKNEEREKRMGMSLIGPHRDDFGIFINEKEAKYYASQGQQRSVALAIKMGEVKLIEDDTGQTPVLLLDDVLSELDENRRGYVLKNIDNIQVIITCTEKDFFGNMKNINLINIKNVIN